MPTWFVIMPPLLRGHHAGQKKSCVSQEAFVARFFEVEEPTLLRTQGLPRYPRCGWLSLSHVFSADMTSGINHPAVCLLHHQALAMRPHCYPPCLTLRWRWNCPVCALFTKPRASIRGQWASARAIGKPSYACRMKLWGGGGPVPRTHAPCCARAV